MEITPRISPCRASSLAAKPSPSPPPATATTPAMPTISASFASPVTARTVTSISLQAVFHAPGIAALEIAVARQRPEREEFRIAVIVQIEDARKTPAGVMGLRPQAVGLLRRLQIIHPARHGRMIHLPRRHQAQQRPGGL